MFIGTTAAYQIASRPAITTIIGKNERLIQNRALPLDPLGPVAQFL